MEDGLHEKVESIFLYFFRERDLTKAEKCAAWLLTGVSNQALVIESIYRPKLQEVFPMDNTIYSVKRKLPQQIVIFGQLQKPFAVA